MDMTLSERIYGNPKYSEKAGSVTFAEACESGLPGRVAWALVILGRRPNHDAVRLKAQIPEKSRDLKQDYEAAITELRTQGLVEFDKDRIWLNPTRGKFVITCSARGCEEKGPQGKSPAEARTNAEGDGFVFQGDLALCPEHTALATASTEGLGRSDRRRLERLQKKLRRSASNTTIDLELK